MSKKDHFQRLPFAVDLLNMVKTLPTPFSFGLDAEWGAGKTFFIDHVLMPLCVYEKFPCIVYNAFEHEKEDDVFLSLMTSILEQAQNLLNKNDATKKLDPAIANVVEKTAKVVATLSNILLNAGAKFLLKQSLEELQKAVGDKTPDLAVLSKELENETAIFLKDKLKNGKTFKLLKNDFQQSIKELACSLSETHGRILVVIDELDRCSPHHALKVFEATNHILNSDGLIFMFSYNREQIEVLVEHVYGKQINAGEYLQKFVSLNFKFPSIEPHSFKMANKLLMEERALKHNSTFENNGILVNALSYISRWTHIKPMTPRQLQRYTSTTLTISKKISYDLQDFLSNAEIATLTYFQVTNPSALKKLLDHRTSTTELTQIMKELQFDEFLPKQPNRAENLSDFLNDTNQLSSSQRTEIYRLLEVFLTL